MSVYQVVVGNAGQVHEGHVLEVANDVFTEYLQQSRLGRGRVAGEPVYLMKDGELVLSSEDLPKTPTVEERLAKLETGFRDAKLNFIMTDEFDSLFEKAARDADLITDKDVEQDYVRDDELDLRIERWVDDSDLVGKDDLRGYVTEDSLTQEIETALEDTDLVKEVTAGAVEAAMTQLDRKLNRYVTVDRLDERENKLIQMFAGQIEILAATARNLTFLERLRWLLTGKVTR
jgi:hypothetical protein